MKTVCKVLLLPAAYKESGSVDIELGLGRNVACVREVENTSHTLLFRFNENQLTKEKKQAENSFMLKAQNSLFPYLLWAEADRQRIAAMVHTVCKRGKSGPDI